jgi:AsmA protein
VPVQLSGPFEAIDWKVQWSGVAAAAVENKLKEKIAEKLFGKPDEPAASAASAPAEKTEDKIKQKLRGLLGR